MRILEWVSRKFNRKHAVPDDAAKHFSNGAQVPKDEDARGGTLTLQFSNWQHGLLAIGTFGLDTQLDRKEATAHALKVIEVDDRHPVQKDDLVDAIVGLSGDLDGTNPNSTVDGKAGGCKFICNKDKRRNNAEYAVGIIIHALEEFFKDGTPLGASVHNKKRSGAARTLGNAFFGYKWTRDKLIDVENYRRDTGEKGDEAPEKRGCSILKNILQWKITGSRSSKNGHGKFIACPQRKLHKLIRVAAFNKKIPPESIAAALRGTGSGDLGASKTFDGNAPNASKLRNTVDRYEHNEDGPSIGDLNSRNGENNESYKQYNVDDVEEEKESGSNNNSTAEWEEPLSLSRNNSGGSRGYWVKTDSEYVVLEL